MSHSRSGLKQSDSAVLRHIRRYRFGIPEFLARDLPDHPVDLTLGRLARRRGLRQELHSSGLTYFRVIGDRLPSDVALIRAFGIMDFCCGQSPRRPLIDHKELQQYFPTLFRHGLPSAHYLTSVDGQTRLGHVRVDAVPSRIDRIVSRTCQLIDRYRSQPGFRELIASHQFEMTWVVATEQKANRLRPALAALSTSGAMVRVHVVPALIELISPIGSSGQNRAEHQALPAATSMAARPSHHSRP
jgi:hypothetical protein